MKELVVAEAVAPMRAELEKMLLAMSENALGEGERADADGAAPDGAAAEAPGVEGEGEGPGAAGPRLLPSRFGEALGAIERGDDSYTSAVLSCCQLRDEEVASLAAALSAGGGGGPELLDLSYNDITDVGVQALVAALASGAAARVATLRLAHNPGITAVGRSMLNGLALMRKAIAIEM